MTNFIELLYVKEETYCVNVYHDRRSRDAYCMVVEVWAKADKGIQYSVQSCELIKNPGSKVKEWVDKTRRFGLASHRPYSPGQACDGEQEYQSCCRMEYSLSRKWGKSQEKGPLH